MPAHYRSHQDGRAKGFILKIVVVTKETRDRYWSSVARGRPNECWPWTGSVNQAGYGTFSVGGTAMPAHRFGFNITVGRIPKARKALHTCDIPNCCNPAHIYSGTPQDNADDCALRGRRTGLARDDNPAMKLPSWAVEICRKSTATNASLAARFDVSPSCISYARTGGVNWTNRRRDRPNQWRIRTRLRDERLATLRKLQAELEDA